MVDSPDFVETSEVSVFVWVRQGPEEFRPVASTIRLEVLDSSHMDVVDSHQVSVTMSRKPFRLVINGELGIILRLAGV